MKVQPTQISAMFLYVEDGDLKSEDMQDDSTEQPTLLEFVSQNDDEGKLLLNYLSMK